VKSMKTMQDGILSKAKFDGTYPKIVHMGMGIIALAKNQDDFDRLSRSREHTLVFAVVACSLGAIGLIVCSVKVLIFS